MTTATDRDQRLCRAAPSIRAAGTTATTATPVTHSVAAVMLGVDRFPVASTLLRAADAEWIGPARLAP